MSDTPVAATNQHLNHWANTCAVILAGGLGTRLSSVIRDKPKCLAPILGRPFLAHQLERLAQAGLDSAVICTGYLAEQVEEAIGNQFGSLQIIYSQETEPLGTAGAIRLAAEQTAAGSLLVLNGDSVCSAELNAFAGDFLKVGAQPLMLLTKVEDTARYGRVECENQAGTGRVSQFLEKGIAGAGWINAGIYLLPRHLVMEFPAGRACSIEKEIFPAWVEKGLLHASRIESEFLDIGTPESYNLANDFSARLQK